MNKYEPLKYQKLWKNENKKIIMRYNIIHNNYSSMFKID